MTAQNAIRLRLLDDIGDVGSERGRGFMSKSETQGRNSIAPQQTVGNGAPFVITSVELRACRLV